MRVYHSLRETNIAPRQHINTVRKAIKVPCEPKTAFAKAMWIAKAVDRSLDSASCEAKIVSDCKTISALHRAKPRLSCEDEGKMSACFAEAISCEARTATMPSPNSGAVTPHANLVLPIKVTNSTTDTAPVP